MSPRSERSFTAINCAAIPEHLLESELFGHMRGAFTGATADRPGLFELAHEGTLLLDEIGDLPLDLQAKLLRVLEEGEIRRVGGREPKRVDVRVVAATAKPLEQAVERGEFRSDLFYRLNVVRPTCRRSVSGPRTCRRS
jgi:transcriptional regulator with GAF, ATPase, and Fis domain